MKNILVFLVAAVVLASCQCPKKKDSCDSCCDSKAKPADASCCATKKKS